jgi:hypothetical protein
MWCGKGGRACERGGGGREGTYFIRIAKLSLRHSTTLYNNTSFSLACPTTYSITSLSLLKTTTLLSYRITSLVCFAVFSSRPFSNAFCSFREA